MVLVTGGAGFIGSHTVAALVGTGRRVRVLDNLVTGRRENLAGLDAELIVGDIRDPSTVTRAMAGCRHVIHLAARPGVPESCEDPMEFDATNIHGTVVVFETARRCGVERVVYASSSAIYGSSDAPVKREDQPLLPESPYAVAKAANELYARVYTTTLGLPCVGLRYFNVFGPRQDPHGPYAAVIPRFVEQALQVLPLSIFGDGEQTRDFVPVADVARANMAALMARDAAGRAFNVGSARATTVNGLAAHVTAMIGTNPGIAYHPARPGDVRHSLSDISAARAFLGWSPTAPFDQALAETIDGYRATLQGHAGA